MDLLTSVLWLTLNVYHEARGEDKMGQIAVAHVTLNRSKARDLSIKETVLQPKQFSWTHDDKSYFPFDLGAFVECLDSVGVAAVGHDFTQGATYYHAKRINPYWAAEYTLVSQYGNHKFYRR